MIENENTVRDFIISFEEAIRYSRFESIRVILKDAVTISLYSGNIDMMLTEGILTTVASVYDSLINEMYPTWEELEKVRLSISEELLTMVKAIDTQEEKKFWNSLIGLPKLVLDLRARIRREDRTKPEKISVDFEVNKTKKRIYEEFIGKEEPDLLEEILAKLIKRIGRGS